MPGRARRHSRARHLGTGSESDPSPGCICAGIAKQTPGSAGRSSLLRIVRGEDGVLPLKEEGSKVSLLCLPERAAQGRGRRGASVSGVAEITYALDFRARRPDHQDALPQQHFDIGIPTRHLFCFVKVLVSPDLLGFDPVPGLWGKPTRITQSVLSISPAHASPPCTLGCQASCSIQNISRTVRFRSEEVTIGLQRQ